MNERATFELRLAAAFDAYADDAPMSVDATSLAATIVRADRRELKILGRSFARPGWLVPVLLTILLAVALVAAAYVGAQLLRRDPVSVIQLPPPKTYAGVLRPVARGQIEPNDAIGLRDGRVFAQYTGFQDHATYQMLDPDAGIVRDLGAGTAPRAFAAMVELPDGQILVVGSDYAPTNDIGGFGPTAPTTAETIHIESSAIRIGPAGPMVEARFIPTAVALDDGRVLVAGGLVPSTDGSSTPLASAEVFDPATNEFTPVGSMSIGRARPIVVTLRDGKVALIGDTYEPSDQRLAVDVFDPATNVFTSIAGPTVVGFRHGTALADGRVFIAAGHCEEYRPIEGDGTSDTAKPVSAFIYDPVTSTTTDAPAVPHCVTNVVGLPDGRAFVSGYYYTGAPNAGGNNGSNRLVTWSGIYDLTEGVVQLTQGPRGYLPQATSLSDGRVFLWGGGIGWTDDDRGSEMDPAWGDILE